MKGNANLTNRAVRSSLEDTIFTPPSAVHALLERERFVGSGWEPASGSGNIAKCFDPPLMASDLSTEDWVYRQLVAGLLLEQEGKCAICLEPLQSPYEDHRHHDSLVRGLLCSSCNSMLGFSKEDPERLRRGAAYLERG